MLVTSIYHYLEKHPLLGVISGFGAYGINYINAINLGTEVLKFVGAGLGVGIAALTLYIKIIELRKNKRK